MDLSYHGDVVFLGGSTTNTINSNSKGIVRACVFNRKLSSVGTYIFDRDDMRDITAVHRLPKSDVIAVGGFKHLYVLQFKKQEFTPLFIFNNIHSGKGFTFFSYE